MGRKKKKHFKMKLNYKLQNQFKKTRLETQKAIGNSYAELNTFKRNPSDCGSPELQIARLTDRIAHLSTHLSEHKHDNSTKRGLTLIIGKRFSLLSYLSRKDQKKYRHLCSTLGIKR